jgi:TolB-like protein
MLRHALVLLSLTATVAVAPSADRSTAAAPKTLAVLYFDNHTGQPDYDPLGRGIASMLISDLAAVREIQLVERERLQDIVGEIERQQTQYFDSTTAVKVGRMVGAEYVVVGAFAAIQPRMRIDTRVVRVETGEIVKTAQVTGQEDRFFELERQLAERLVDGLGLALSPEEQARLRARQDSNRVENVATMLRFSEALALYDREDYVGAAERMVPVMQASPNSMLMRMTYDQIKGRLTRSATEQVKDRVNKGLRGILRPPR